MDNESLAHTKYNCTYHVVFIPTYRRKKMYGELKKVVLPANKMTLYNMSVPPKISISTAMSRIKGKSSLMIFDRHPEKRDKYGRHFWARGYYCETVGNVNEETIKKYITEQENSDRIEG